MKKKTLLIAAVVLAAAIGGGVWWYTSQPVQAEEPEPQDDVVVVNAEPQEEPEPQEQKMTGEELQEYLRTLSDEDFSEFLQTATTEEELKLCLEESNRRLSEGIEKIAEEMRSSGDEQAEDSEPADPEEAEQPQEAQSEPSDNGGEQSGGLREPPYTLEEFEQWMRDQGLNFERGEDVKVGGGSNTTTPGSLIHW